MNIFFILKFDKGFSVHEKKHFYRNNSEKLAIKIREQATAIIYLNTEKEKFLQEIDMMQQQIKKLTQELEGAAYDKEKIKVRICL